MQNFYYLHSIKPAAADNFCPNGQNFWCDVDHVKSQMKSWSHCLLLQTRKTGQLQPTMQKDKKKSCKCRQKIIIKNNSTSECTTDVILSRVRVANMKLHISLPLCCHFVATSFAPGLEFHSSQPISGLSELNKLFACFESLPFAFGRSTFAQEVSKIISAEEELMYKKAIVAAFQRQGNLGEGKLKTDHAKGKVTSS